MKSWVNKSLGSTNMTVLLGKNNMIKANWNFFPTKKNSFEDSAYRAGPVQERRMVTVFISL